MGAVYWVGADGNVWLKDASGTRNVGAANGTGLGQGDNWGLQAGGFESNTLQQSIQAQRIADPNPPASVAPAGGSAAAAPAKPDKSNDIAVQQAGLGAVDQQTTAGLAAIDRALQSLIGNYDTESTANEGNYGQQSNTNKGNLQTNKQSAFVNAAQGRQGLMGTLASLGALSGSGIQLANRAVQQGANTDLAGAEGTYGENQSGLDTAIGTFRQQDKQRRDNAGTSAGNARTNVQNQAAKNKQTFYSNIANDYAEMGNAGEASRYTGLAASLYPQVAATSIPDSNLNYTAAAFTPGTLANYIAGAGDTTVSSSPTGGGGTGSNLPTLVANNQSLKKKQQQPVLAT